MKNIFFYLSSALIVFSCKTNTVLKKTSYQLDKATVLCLYLPKGYLINKYQSEKSSIYYKYPDGSIFYVTDNTTGDINSTNIIKDSLYKKVTIAELDKDTITVVGLDAKGDYWKYAYRNTFGIGYKNANLKMKGQFDTALNSLTIKHK